MRFLLLFLFARSAFAADYSSVDEHALAAPPQIERSLESLAGYLSENAHGDEEKARAIYRWVTDRVEYDAQAYLSGRIRDEGPFSVLQRKRSVCSGYAKLFEALGRASGLEVATIRGHAKGYGYSSGSPLAEHEWNAVRIDGSWRLVDATWGAGYMKEGRFFREFSERFFLASPDELAFTHFPENPSWQSGSHLTRREFESLPLPGPAFFNLGISGKSAWNALSSPSFGGEFVHTFDTPWNMVKVNDAPLAYRLPGGTPQHWILTSSAFEEMALRYGKHWITMDSVHGSFEGTLTPVEPGEILVLGRKPGEYRYEALLAYRVD